MNGFPKEAVFQHLFMEGLARFASPECYICPELSRIFPNDTQPGELIYTVYKLKIIAFYSNNVSTCIEGAIDGEIDLYLNGSLRWGIELSVNGIGIGEHMARVSESIINWV